MTVNAAVACTGMPVVDDHGSCHRTALAVVRVHEDARGAPVSAGAWLRGGELDRLARFRVEPARRDYLAGRIAAKSALMVVSDTEQPGAWEIVSDVTRAPEVAGPVSGLTVTIAHSGGVGLAWAVPAGLRCGVDIERSERDASDVVESQVSPEEAVWARAGEAQAETRWMLLWTAREALGKYHRVGLVAPEKLAPSYGWRETTEGWTAGFRGQEHIGLGAMVCGGFVASFAVPASVVASILPPFARILREVLNNRHCAGDST